MRLSVLLRHLVALAVLTPTLAQAGEVPPAQNLHDGRRHSDAKGFANPAFLYCQLLPLL